MNLRKKNISCRKWEIQLITYINIWLCSLVLRKGFLIQAAILVIYILLSYIYILFNCRPKKTEKIALAELLILTRINYKYITFVQSCRKVSLYYTRRPKRYSVFFHINFMAACVAAYVFKIRVQYILSERTNTRLERVSKFYSVRDLNF